MFELIILELNSLAQRTNWYQRARLTIGILEFFIDIHYNEDAEQRFFLCSPLSRAFGYDKNFEVKVNHLSTERPLSIGANALQTSSNLYFSLFSPAGEFAVDKQTSDLRTR